MAMSKRVSNSLILTGCSLLVLTFISVICGWVVLSKMTKPAASVSIGLWGFYFAVPGVLSVVAGVRKQSNLLPVALATNILGIILATVGLSVGAELWVLLTDCLDETYDYVSYDYLSYDYCYCNYYNNQKRYRILCSKLMTIHRANGAVTIIFAICAIVTLVGSIYGCIGICCPQQEPAVTVTTAQPGAMAMTTQTNPAGSQQPQPYYPGQVVVDSKPLI